MNKMIFAVAGMAVAMVVGCSMSADDGSTDDSTEQGLVSVPRDRAIHGDQTGGVDVNANSVKAGQPDPLKIGVGIDAVPSVRKK